MGRLSRRVSSLGSYLISWPLEAEFQQGGWAERPHGDTKREACVPNHQTGTPGPSQGTTGSEWADLVTGCSLLAHICPRGLRRLNCSQGDGRNARRAALNATPVSQSTNPTRLVPFKEALVPAGSVWVTRCSPLAHICSVGLRRLNFSQGGGRNPSMATRNAKTVPQTTNPARLGPLMEALVPNGPV